MRVNRRELFYTVSMLLAIAGIVFFLNITILSSAWSISLFRGRAQVKAVTIVRTSKPHFLTAAQKLELLTLLNDGNLFDKQEPLSSHTPGNFKKLTLHCYEESTIDVIPVGTSGDKLVFAVEQGQERSLFVEKQAGQIQKVVDNALED